MDYGFAANAFQFEFIESGNATIGRPKKMNGHDHPENREAFSENLLVIHSYYFHVG